MREFYSRLLGGTVFVAACGEGRDSRYLKTLGARLTSFDLSLGMLSLARASDPRVYLHLDLRHAQTIEASMGVFVLFNYLISWKKCPSGLSYVSVVGFNRSLNLRHVWEF